MLRVVSVRLIAAIAVALVIGAPAVCAAQAVSAADREALVRLRVDRGGRAEDVDGLIRQVDEAAAKGLPVAPLTNKIREGFAKGHDTMLIDSVVKLMSTNLEGADRLLREGFGSAGREAVTLMAESLGGGVTPDEIRELGRQSQSPGKNASQDALAAAAKGLAFIKDARLPAADGTAVMAESVKHGFAVHEMLDLGREIKRRERDYQTGRANLRALRDAIARGDRPEQLFAASRREAAAATRPTDARPGTTVERPAAGRPEAPERPAAPERPTRPERPERPTSGTTRDP